MKHQRLQHWILAGDIAWAIIALPLAYLMRYGLTWYGPTDGTFLTFVPPLLVSVVLWAILFTWMKLDGFRLGWNLPATLSQLLLALSLLMTILLAGAYVLRIFLSRLTLGYFGILLFIGFLTLRCGAHAILGSRYLAKAVRRVLIVGDGPVARELATKITLHPEMLCQVIGFLCSADAPFDVQGSDEVGNAEVVNTLGVIDLIRARQIDEIIITLANPVSSEVMNLADQFRREGIGVSVVPHPYELYVSRPQLLDIGGLPVLQLRDAKSNFASSTSKRILDVVFGALLFLFCLPFMVVGAILLATKNGGPFVRELRCGQFGKQFWMCRLNSDRNSRELPFIEVMLQRLSITEMPQFWNVLRGDMSLVGPRPEPPERVKHYSEWQRQRLNVRPGISGLAQVYGLRETHSSEAKARFDLQYLMHASLFFDFSLILQTGWTLIRRLFEREGWTSPSEPVTSIGPDHVLQRSLSSAHSTQPSAD